MPEAVGRHAVQTAKASREFREVVEAAVQGDVLHGLRALQQRLRSASQTLAQHVLVGRAADTTAELPDQSYRFQAAMVGHHLQRPGLLRQGIHFAAQALHR